MTATPSNRGTRLETIYHNTRWAKSRWRHGLRLLPGAVPMLKRYGSGEHRGTFIPARYLDVIEPPSPGAHPRDRR